MVDEHILVSALERIAHATRRKQLPITNEVNEIATEALAEYHSAAQANHKDTQIKE